MHRQDQNRAKTWRKRAQYIGEAIRPPDQAHRAARREEPSRGPDPSDERFAPAWFEDVDYCRRLAERQKEIWVVPAAHAQHFGGASLEHMDFAGFVDIWYRNMWRYAHKWMRPGQAEVLRWTIVAGMFLRCAAGLVGLHPRGVGRLDAFRGYAAVMKKAFDRWDSSLSSS